MIQIQLKYNLPFSSFSETVELNKETSLFDLKNLVWEFFQIPLEKQFIKLCGEKNDVK